MQLSAMKALRSISFHKHRFAPSNTKPLQTLPRTPIFSRQFRASSSSQDAPKTWTVFNPLTRRPTDSDVAAESSSSSESDRPIPRSASARKLKDYSIGEFVANKKKGKAKTAWVCSSCGYSDGQWWGMCRSCRTQGTMTEFSAEPNLSRSSDPKAGPWVPKEDQVLPVRLKDVTRGVRDRDWRIIMPGILGEEIGTVLGGGLVPGSLALIGGDPGVGKSTLLLQMAALISGGCEPGTEAPVLYVSGEESIEQIGDRADRLEINTDELYLYSSTDVEDIIHKAQHLSPRALIIDSIQTVYLNNVTGTAGGLIQVKECTMALLRFAKKTGVPVLLIGHVTKSGEIAGPRVLEHIVDVVMYMEGDKRSSHRLLRSVKNRFGSTDELGVFEMSQTGFQAVKNSSGIFLSEDSSGSKILAGLAVAVTMDGSRSFLLEIQALCVSGSVVSRQVNGIQANRAEMIISVLIKQVGLKLQQNAIFLNVVSGIALTETAGDLAVAAAICSSFLEYPIPDNIAFIGEIGLGGELRTVPRIDKRVHTLAKLGYKKCIVPKSAEKSIATSPIEGMEIIGCGNLKEFINSVFILH